MPLGRIGQDFIANTEFFSRQGAPSSTALADGRFVVTWNSFDEGDGSGVCVRGRVFNPDGSPAGDDFIVNSTGDGAQDSISVAALVDGRFVAVWSSADPGDGSDRCIRARVFDADGSAVDLDFVANSVAGGAQTAPVATGLADGRFAVMWQSADTADGSAGCIRARLFDADGAPVGGDFVVNSTAGNAQVLPTLTSLADGRLMATWTSNDTGDGSGACVRGRLYTATGAPQGDDFIVNSTTTGSQYLSVVAALPNGGFITAWYSEDLGDGSLGCVRARVYNASGISSGPDFIVNSVSAGSQLDPAIATLPDGRFVIAWSSDDAGDGSGSCIRARLFAADGSAAGADFIVNTSVTNTQAVPSVTALTDGRFVVSWESDDGGEGGSSLLGSCIRAQIFDANTFVGTVGEDTWQGSNLFGDAINGGGSADVLSGLGGADQISGDAGNDTLNGGEGNDRLFGGSDADTLRGESGADTMSGGSGADILYGGLGADSLIGGEGLDYARYDDADYGNLVINLSAPGTNTGAAAGDTFSGIECIVSGAGNDTVVGDANANRLFGGGGNDIVRAGVGADYVEGGAGNDHLYGGAGADSIVGGEGLDYARYDEGNYGNLTIRLDAPGANTGAAAGDTYSGIECIVAGAGNDTVYGDAAANRLIGMGGNDTIDGRAGSDYLEGGAGVDNYRFSTALGATNVDTIAGFQHGVDNVMLHSSIFAGIGPTLTANEFGTTPGAGRFIVYLQNTGQLFYDEGGAGVGAGPRHFATVTAGTVLDINDFVVV